MASRIQGRCPALKPIKWYKDLWTSKGRRSSGCFLVEGIRGISLIRKRCPQAVLEICVRADSRDQYAEFSEAVVFGAKLFDSICASRSPQGIAAVVRLPHDYESESLPGDCGNRIIYLDDIQDPGNVGTLIRTAAALGYAGVMLTPQCADPFGPKAVASSAGSVLSLWIRRSVAVPKELRRLVDAGFDLVAADANGAQSFDLGEKGFVLALGNEGNGLSAEVRSMTTSTLGIAMDHDKAESLNVGAAGAICMHVLAAARITGGVKRL